MEAKPQNNQKHIVVITRSSRFPKGMAASQRITMIGRAILSGGHTLRVLCLVPWDRDSANPLPVMGEHYGIDYEYTAGTAIRSDNFWVRRWLNNKGTIIAFFRIMQYRIQKKLDCIYIYDRAYHINYLDLLFILYARFLRIPVIREMNERPWALKEDPSFMERLISPLLGVRGVIAISSLIKEWIKSEDLRRKSDTLIADVPILTDINEIGKNKNNGVVSYVLFAGAPDYDETLKFILDAMDVVWKTNPECLLYLTGFKSEDEAGRWVTKEILKRTISNRVRICGYLPREELLNNYVGAKALLIPLFDDIRSKARFPTKIGEYLASSTPIITNDIGEISSYFKDGRDACIAEPGDASIFGRKITECLIDHEKARKIGLNGQLLAERCFHYESHSEALAILIQNLT